MDTWVLFLPTVSPGAQEEVTQQGKFYVEFTGAAPAPLHDTRLLSTVSFPLGTSVVTGGGWLLPVPILVPGSRRQHRFSL